MLPDLSKIKGLHPGSILRRELKIQGLKSVELANSIDEHKQTISAILNKRRDINPKLSIKLSQHFNIEEDYFMILQASYDVKKASESELKKTPNLDNIREVLFWDTNLNNIDWDKNKKSVIQRVLERGNSTEITEIIAFYGRETISEIIKHISSIYPDSLENTIEFYNLR